MSKRSHPNQPTKEQVLEWIEAYQKNEDEEAQTNLVNNYKRLVESIARKYSNGKSYHEDIAQVGMLGLLGAIRRYDPSFGRSFEAFAVPTIIGEIKRFLRDKTWAIHVPRRIKELGPRIKATVEVLTRELQRSPQVWEIAEYLDVDEDDVLEAMEMGKSYQALSMDHSLEADSDGSTVTLFDVVGQEDDGYEKADQRMLVANAMNVLSEREKQIIQYTYIEQLSQKETGDKLGISQMHVSRLQRKAIKKLQEAILAAGGVS
ncbi:MULTISPECIES: RNA polymerase sigma factor SigB [Caryophanaceae]|jgi:RNA polymerase sigma-B factor|uniref:RNA polymerase sigma-37 (RpsB/SigB) subunit n=1 Tax=Planomicrobium soli TaxID=1176648 RepID=A0A2P8G4E6_9BACL|nr:MULTISPECIES: RNA polymerase sigma factor SigB [Planomicrobium]PSL28851.1 RNA polymerase sigma-37 (RpsB/SigB) subunit [Planomicrobium soli]TWT02197.1 RNA polymerase sigma factor SigB [Planomicrobium sp. CPCC 101079]TWT24603.1 RNA polymerase sigma factor SigB [Planomicrobium sp. CPCC 101110]